jgi:endonuclease YncB( thermonuclease family)
MVKAGLAWHFKQYAKKDTDLATAEQEAREAKRGLWQHNNPTPPWEFRKDKSQK